MKLYNTVRARFYVERRSSTIRSEQAFMWNDEALRYSPSKILYSKIIYLLYRDFMFVEHCHLDKNQSIGYGHLPPSKEK